MRNTINNVGCTLDAEKIKYKPNLKLKTRYLYRAVDINGKYHFGMITKNSAPKTYADRCDEVKDVKKVLYKKYKTRKIKLQTDMGLGGTSWFKV